MNEDLNNLKYYHIRDFDYAKWFEDVHYNGKTLSETEREKFVTVTNKTIAQQLEGFPLIHETLERNKGQHDEYGEIYRTVASVMLFVLITTVDSLVASKYFILADGDYDKRFMRGKLMVILNEGFKRLYGFNEKSHKKSEWDRLLPLLNHFPEEINLQYQELTYHLEMHAKTSSWWKEVRNWETHLDAEKLYNSRQEDIIESKVMMDSMKLFSTLLAVNYFLTNVHAYLSNIQIEKYKRGEIKEE